MLELRFKFKFKFKLKRRTSSRQDPNPWGGWGSERDGQEGNNEEEKMAKKGKEGRTTKQIEIGKGTRDRLRGARPQQCEKARKRFAQGRNCGAVLFSGLGAKTPRPSRPRRAVDGNKSRGEKGEKQKSRKRLFLAPTALRTAPAQTRANQSVKPPVISIAAPLMYLASSEAKNANRLAISSGSAKRRAGILAANLSKTS